GRLGDRRRVLGIYPLRGRRPLGNRGRDLSGDVAMTRPHTLRFQMRSLPAVLALAGVLTLAACSSPTPPPPPAGDEAIDVERPWHYDPRVRRRAQRHRDLPQPRRRQRRAYRRTAR